MPTYEAGTYRAEVSDQGFAVSAAKGTPYFFLTVRIKSRCGDRGAQHPCPRFERTVHLYVNTDIGVRILRDHLRALEVEVTDLTRLALDSSDPVSLVGREIVVECAHEEYAGQTRERWRIARPAPKRT